MAIPEIEKFRAKYPEYNGIDDATLAGKLAAKYPDAYGALPEKVKGENKIERSAGQKIAHAVAPYARPVLETSGLILGGAAGGALGGATGGIGAMPGAVAGAGTGYAGARRLANAVEEYAGDRTPRTLVNNLASTGTDVLSGAEMEAGGQGVNWLLKKGVQFIPTIARDTYLRVMKPVPSMSKSDRNTAASLGLEKGYAVTESGAKKAGARFNKLMKDVDGIVKGMDQTETLATRTPRATPPFTPAPEKYAHGGGYVVRTGPNTLSMSRGVEDWFKTEAEAGAHAKSLMSKPEYQRAMAASQSARVTKEVPAIDMRQVIKSIEKPLLERYGNLPDKELETVQGLLTEYASKRGGRLTPVEAQEMKKDLYRYITDASYGEIASTTKETLKGVARGVRMALSERDKSGLLNKVNKEEAEHIIFREIQERALNRTGNWDILGLSDLAGSGVGAVTEGYRKKSFGGASEGAIVGAAIARTLRSPAIMSRIAIGLAKAGKLNPNQVGKLIMYEALGGKEQQR